MAEEGVLIALSSARELARLLRSSRQPDAAPTGTTFPGRPLTGLVRAVLLEPLYGHGQALAVTCERIRSHELQDVQIVGTVNTTTGRFKLSILWERVTYTSDWIAWDATADELLDALTPWTFLVDGDLRVSLGTFDNELVPDELDRPDQPMVLCRWTLAFVADKFLLADVPHVQVSADETGSLAIVITHPSSWQEDGEIIQIFEAGLFADSPQSINVGSRRTPLPAGSALVVGWCEKAQGYIQAAAEPRKFQI